MALNQFNLTDLFQATWGYRPSNINLSSDAGSTTSGTTGKLNFGQQNLVNKKSKAGQYGSYYKKDLQGRDVFMPLTLGGYFLPYVWLSVRCQKILVETPMTERRGKVIELISFDNYEIGVKGFAIGHDGTFPESDIEDLKELFELQQSVECSSVLTDIFLLTKNHGGKDRVVMRDLEIMDNQGIEHVRAFQFTLTSDQILELEVA